MGKSAEESTREMAEGRHRTRFRFVLPMAGIVIVLIQLAGIGLFAVVGLAVIVRAAMDFTDAKEKKMIKQDRRELRELGAKKTDTLNAR